MYILLFFFLLSAACCDQKYNKIPNRLILIGIMSAITSSVFTSDWFRLLERIGLSVIIFLVLYVFFQIGALGAGDIKLLMVMSLFLSLSELLSIVFISSNIALLSVCVVVCRNKRLSLKIKKIPLGLSIFWGYGIWFFAGGVVVI